MGVNLLNQYELGNTKIFTLNSNKELAAEITELMNCELGKCTISRFSDGEIQIHVGESVRGKEIFLIQSTSDPINENLMELLILIDALKRASAGTINCLIPYFGYARQDRKARSREPITAKLVANLLEKAGANRVITMDLHSAQLQGFFNIPLEHLTGIPILSEYYRKKDLKDVVVVAPHNGSIGRARKMANLLDAPLALVDKRQEEDSDTFNVIGDVQGRNVIIIDDLIDTGMTISLAAKALAENGAKTIYAACTHAVFTGEFRMRIESSPIHELVITNTIQLPQDKQLKKLKTLSIAPLLVEAIDRIHNHKTISPLLE